MNESVLTKITAVGTAVLASVFVLVPFHALLTIAISTLVGHYDLWRLWKEILLLLLTPLAAIVVWKTPGLWKQLRRGWLFWALVCYVLLHLILGLLALAKGQVNTDALLYAWVVNLRLVLVFVLAWIFAARSSWLHDRWRWLLLVPASLVILFGLLQAVALPVDFLKHFGYGHTTIEPFETVDQKLDYIRIQSTLRGANPFGAYLVLVLGAVLVLVRRGRDKLNIGYLVLLVAGLCALMATYSRSAYLGFGLTAVAVLALLVRSQVQRRRLVVGMAVLAVTGVGLLAVFRDNDRVENTFFHTDEHSTSAASSNQQRASALQSGVHDVLTQPFGRGPGTAGPASAHNRQPARIAENYYLQIGQETGWLGIGLFIAIVCMIGKRLWRRRQDPLARVLLVALVGLSFVNLVQHAWTDDTLAMLWWGLAGVAVATPLYTAPESETSDTQKAKKTKKVASHGKKATAQ